MMKTLKHPPIMIGLALFIATGFLLGFDHPKADMALAYSQGFWIGIVAEKLFGADNV